MSVKQSIQNRIAIIGAGASGLSAAYTLKQQGYENVTVFEREDRVGGKVMTVWHNGKPFEMGAVWVGNNYDTINQYIEDSESKTFIARTPDTFSKNRVVSNHDFIRENYNFLSFVKSFFRLLKIQLKHREIFQYGFKGVDKELNLPMKEFQAKHGLHDFTSALAPFITGCGYGYYDEVPAIYCMKMIPKLIFSVVKQAFFFHAKMRSFNEGWQSLFDKLAKEVGDIRLSSPVETIKTNSGKDSEKVTIVAGGKSEEFDQVIIATPLQHLGKIMDLSVEQQKLFSQIKSYRYLITMVEGENLINASFASNTTPDTVGHLNFILTPYEDHDVHGLFQLLPNKMTHEEALKIAKDDIAKFGGKITKVIMQKEWEYFPHVKQATLDAGFYDTVEKMQGQNGIYFVGGVMSFETVEDTTAYARNLVYRFF